MEILWILVVISLISWTIFVQYSARQQVDLTVAMSERDAASAVLDFFGLMWTQTDGAGDVNYRPKLRAHAPTLSISFAPAGTSECEISIWTSHYKTRYGIMGHAQLMWRKKRALAARLSRSAGATDNWSKAA
jgi:hypothetical protein